jgi:GTP-binding protein
MKHILAIVGRPNVGKSTLFNRLVGGRDAIVHDEPGVTRDRHYATAEWAGKIFTIIDTGGFVPDSEDVFEQAIREQAQIAISEASAVLFVVDAQSGVTTIDAEVANILRRSKKRIHLVVNKVDNLDREIDAAPFFKLGLGDPFNISALGGRNIGDLLDLVTDKLPAVDPDEVVDPRLKLAIIGKPNVGKSSLVNVLTGKNRTIVTPIAGTTRDAIDSVLKYEGEEILLIDTAGLRRKSRVKESVEFYSTLRTLKSIDRCDVAILLVDAETGIDKQDLRIMEEVSERHCGIVLAANKWDTVEKNDQTAKAYEEALRNVLRIYDYVPIVFISALKKQRVFKVIEIAKTVYAHQTTRISTNKLNTVMLRIIKETPPSSSSGKEIRINYITQVKTDPPAIAFFCNEPTLVQDKYKRFLERKLRENFDFVGVPLNLYFRKKNKER